MPTCAVCFTLLVCPATHCMRLRRFSHMSRSVITPATARLYALRLRKNRRSLGLRWYCGHGAGCVLGDTQGSA